MMKFINDDPHTERTGAITGLLPDQVRQACLRLISFNRRLIEESGEPTDFGELLMFVETSAEEGSMDLLRHLCNFALTSQGLGKACWSDYGGGEISVLMALPHVEVTLTFNRDKSAIDWSSRLGEPLNDMEIYVLTGEPIPA